MIRLKYYLLLVCFLTSAKASNAQYLYSCIDTLAERRGPSPYLTVRQTKVKDTVYSRGLRDNIRADTIHYKQLTYADFQFNGELDKRMQNTLHLHVDLTMSYYFADDTMFYRIEPIMHKSVSWIRVQQKQKEYLFHAQIHFDYLELAARQFRAEVAFWGPYMRREQFSSGMKKWHQKYIDFVRISESIVHYHSESDIGDDFLMIDSEYNNYSKKEVQRKLSALTSHSSPSGYIVVKNPFLSEPMTF